MKRSDSRSHRERVEKFKFSAPAGGSGFVGRRLVDALLGEGHDVRVMTRRPSTREDGTVEIAGDVGYESEAAFNRAFKREFGVPPGRYRRARSGEAVA